MHEHQAVPGVTPMVVLFVMANLAITMAYAAAPFLVLRYLPLTRTVLFWGAVFFLGCAGTHLGMALLIHSNVGLFWTVEHLVQAIGSWGFILTFHAMLRAAAGRRDDPGDDPLAGGGPDPDRSDGR